MKKAKNDGLDNLYNNQNYCLECWEEFTLLSDQERQILKEIEVEAITKKLNRLLT